QVVPTCGLEVHNAQTLPDSLSRRPPAQTRPLESELLRRPLSLALPRPLNYSLSAAERAIVTLRSGPGRVGRGGRMELETQGGGWRARGRRARGGARLRAGAGAQGGPPPPPAPAPAPAAQQPAAARAAGAPASGTGPAAAQPPAAPGPLVQLKYGTQRPVADA